MKPKSVHFVCRGNRYRSRLAEAIFKNYKLANYTITSSGIDTGRVKAEIETYTTDVATAHGIAGELATHKTQTRDKLLQDADVIVFMSKDVYDDASKLYRVDPRKTLVWHIGDIDAPLHYAGTDKRNKALVASLTEKTFKNIEAMCSDLKAYLTTTSWVDITDSTNKPTGLRLPTAWVADRGFWHRGCHAIITTPDKKYIVEKRSKKIIFSPSRLEITLGGAVDSGETPEQAMIREIREELGIQVKPQQLTLIDIYKWSSYHPRYNKYSRHFRYTYHVALEQNDPMLRIQPSEVALATLLSRRKVNRLLRTHRLRHLGSLNFGYSYYRKVIRLSEPYLNQK